ncbi:MAG: hypothetical protein NTW19_16400, partial [Planctomycetota bacterium]|nr:hypothetical protein [Planctomycetota bacterium]
MSIFEHLHVPPSLPEPLAAKLAEAIRLGRAGESARAHTALADHFRATREKEWPWVVGQAKQPRGRVTTGSRPRTRRQRLTHTLDPTDLDWRDLINDLDALVLRPGKPQRNRFIVRLGELVARREELSRTGPYPLLTMLGAEGQFDLFYRGYLALIRTGDLAPEMAEAMLTFLFDLGKEMR